MLVNLVTHFMTAKSLPLHPYQEMWTNWGAVAVFIVVLLDILGITLGDPIARLVRLDLRTWGQQQETILQAQQAALGSDRIQVAMMKRAESDAENLARQIEGNAGYVTAVDDDDFPQSGHGLNGHPVYAAGRSNDRGK